MAEAKEHSVSGADTETEARDKEAQLALQRIERATELARLAIDELVAAHEAGDVVLDLFDGQEVTTTSSLALDTATGHTVEAAIELTDKLEIAFDVARVRKELSAPIRPPADVEQSPTEFAAQDGDQ